ncbi:hypothetical protein M422DRAFT_254754 [Sphaerobolus stellatus SS14]|uniref:Heme haloperoxidase family profile domain-containing protein n=1 Tax=Sphaerobolus stellatus (strain SS14) TaxID=990650 RepID=A0A0C9V596_SPHS4|nr:hypothetical protein M422DRAFT_254754 [Sphaerobolus stellatus SS14]
MPVYESLVGLGEREVNEFITRNSVAPIPNPPAPLAKGQDGLKLSHNAAHPFIILGLDDLRGPCPALNTLANHGFLPRNGAASSDQIVTAVMEGDTSMSRVDAFFVDPAAFNQTRFNDEIPLRPSPRLDQGQPELDFTASRIFSAYSEAVCPIAYFVDGCLNNRQLTQAAARSFFVDQRLLADFHRQPAPVTFDIIESMIGQFFAKYPFTPGVNHGKNNYKLMPKTPALSDFCGIYKDLVLRVIPAQYPKPKGQVKDALKKNLGFLFAAVKENHNCTQAFSYGRCLIMSLQDNQ